jgi:predicted transposase/invertase (TIGR01784 family)
MKMNFANPKTDYVFKRLFGIKGHEKLTISLLNNILNRKQGNLITEVTFCNIENVPVSEDDKESYLDILCKDQAGHYFIIEMQMAKDQAFGKRSIYYSALKIIDQMHDGDPYSKINPVIFIGILNHPMFANKNRVISHHMICDMDTGMQSFDEIEYHYVELSNFHKELDDLHTDLDKWLYFLKQAQDLQVIPSQFTQSPEFKKAFEIIEKSHWTKEERWAYQKSLDVLNKDIRLQAGIFDDGLTEGDRRAKLSVALNLLKLNLAVDKIAQATGLSIEQITRLAEVGIEN